MYFFCANRRRHTRCALVTVVQTCALPITTAVYGIPPAAPITAETPLRPVEPYGKSKLAGERIMAEICGRPGIPLITIRPRATLGAGRLGLFQILFELIRENRTVYVIGRCGNRVQFIQAPYIRSEE